MPALTRRTKIIATIGPASLKEETIAAMIREGMDMVRLNTGYGDFEQYEQIWRHVRKHAPEMPILLDLKGEWRAKKRVAIFSEHDQKVIHWARMLHKHQDRVGHGIQWYALSFTRSSDDIKRLRELVGPEAKVMAKIEDAIGVDRAESIIRAADGVMVGRGDLAEQIGFVHVPIVQKRLIAIANSYSVFDVVATELLESLIKQKEPARSDVSDIANAVLDGADALLLADETAVGKYPIESVRVLRQVIEATEQEL